MKRRGSRKMGTAMSPPKRGRSNGSSKRESATRGGADPRGKGVLGEEDNWGTSESDGEGNPPAPPQTGTTAALQPELY
eukprot:3736145-Pyramimonas_sp.AAC.1